MKEIKVKPEDRKPKLMNETARVPKTAMKDLWLKSKEKSVIELKETPFASQRGESSNDPANNAGNQMLSGTETTVKRGAELTYRGGKNLVQTTARIIKEKREIFRPLSEAKNAGGSTVENAKNTASKMRTKNTAAKAVKGKPQKAVKTASRSMKSVKQSTKGIKTAQRTAKTAQQTAKAAAKATQKAAQVAKATAKSATTGAKVAVKATAAAVKATIAAVKGLITAIAAGGWVAVVVVVVICLVALIACSCFGIFFSSEDTGSEKTMRQVIQEINLDYQNELDAIKDSVAYDALEMSGSRAVWPEVLSIYAVKTTSDPDDPQEVATITPEKEQLLKDLFWEMNEITHRTETRTETVIVETDDGNGNILEEEVQETITTLYITVSHKTADEMAAQYGFNEDQKQQLAELLAQDSSMWAAVLYGIYGVDDQIVAVALSQVGNVGGEPYWSWYGFGSRVEWCACFVSWCANECGYIDTGVIPKFAGCVNGVQWFRERGQWADNSMEPSPGMIIFFDWDNKGSSGPQDGQADHVGIVQKVENSIVFTIEGNSGDSCRINQYPVGYYEILGYGVVAY